jgi:hypothetical protein
MVEIEVVALPRDEIGRATMRGGSPFPLFGT